MDKEACIKMWDTFLEAWPVHRVRAMSLEEYSDCNKDDSFTYWLEFKQGEFGKIRGGSAFKWGVFRQAAPKVQSTPLRVWSDPYAFERKYGNTAETAFEGVKQRILAVIEAVQREDLATIEKIDLWPVVKWKIALLYQNRTRPQVFSIFLPEALFVSYERLVPGAQLKETPQHVMYTKILDHTREDIFELSDRLWQFWEKSDLKKSMQKPIAIDGTQGVCYFKIAPGEKASVWPICRDKGIIAIGWGEFGDLNDFSAEEKRLAAQATSTPFDKHGAAQVALFFSIKPGDRIVANDGKSQVVGIGTVLEGYAYAPGEVMNSTGDYPHQIKVSWDSVAPYRIPTQAGWGQTVVKLKQPAFKHIAALGTHAQNMSTVTIGATKMATNVIFYGPPGTSKTYNTKARALALVRGHTMEPDGEPEAIQREFNQHVASGQIGFVTFHQSFGYEDFVEGIRPVLGNNQDGQVRYILHDGTFKRMALMAAHAGLKNKEGTDDFESLWGQLWQKTVGQPLFVQSKTGKHYAMSQGINGFRITPVRAPSAFGRKMAPPGDGAAKTTLYRVPKSNAKTLWDARHQFGEDLQQFTYGAVKKILSGDKKSEGGHHGTAHWLVMSELLVLSRPSMTQTVTQALAQPNWRHHFSFSAETPQYVLIIDEINRGNISKIFGELITLIEPSKRLDGDDALVLSLTHSQSEKFGVPPNLHIIGTMNTSDRSIALLDVALRRRFQFKAQQPSGVLLQQHLVKVCPPSLAKLTVDLFNLVNKRITYLYDRDHQLGHAYFYGVRSIDDLIDVYVYKVVPLLLEYFHGAWDKVCTVLGCPYNTKGQADKQAQPYTLAKTKDGEPSTGTYLQPFVAAKLLKGKDLGISGELQDSVVTYDFLPEALCALPSGKKLDLALGVLYCKTEADHRAIRKQLRQDLSVDLQTYGA